MLIVKNYSTGYSVSQYLFKELSFEVSPGEVVGLIGMNGCGKSSFIKGLIGLTPFKKGNIYINNIDITDWDTSKIFKTKQIGYLSQRERTFGHLTVDENINIHSMYSKSEGIPNSNISNKLFSYIESKRKLLASTLSGGEQLILSLLCLNILNPDIVLLDEPSDSLDNKHKNLLLQLLADWKQSKKSILIIEQNIEILELISNKIYKIL